MQKNTLNTTYIVFLGAVLSAVLANESDNRWSPPRVDVGLSAGLMANCPGVTKNATISTKSLSKLLIIHHTVSKNGQIHRRTMTIAAAAKLIAKDKSIDLKNKKTLLYSTSYLDSPIFPHNQAVAKEYARRGYNVFTSETIYFLSEIYPKAARLTKPIGEKIGEFLEKLYRYGLDPEKLEMVGLSLGAHVVSHAAKKFYVLTGKKPSRMTGLDPAGPCFRSLPPEFRFGITDAEKVDAVHTNIDGFGLADNVGHVDFYVNGGEYQPGDIVFLPCLVVCSHLKSVVYWWLSLQHTKEFIAVKCDSVQDARFSNCYNNSETNYLGPETNFDKPGIYFLSTGNEFPYYRGKAGLSAETDINMSIFKKINSEDDFVI